jgi:hypothetical protein
MCGEHKLTIECPSHQTISLGATPKEFVKTFGIWRI